MTLTDLLAAYGALLATGLAAWEVGRYFVIERPRLRLTCYVGEVIGGGTHLKNQLVYSIANIGGRPMVVNTIGGQLTDGDGFIRPSELLPRTLQPGESIVIPGAMYERPEKVRYFVAFDALGKEWRDAPDRVLKQLEKQQPPDRVLKASMKN